MTLVDITWILYSLLALFALGVGMAHRAKSTQPRLGRHAARGRLVRELKRDPGARVHELCRRLGLPRGTARYHLYVLERAGAIDSAAVPGRHHYFPPGATEAEIRQLAVLRRERMAEVLGAILESPGIQQQDLLRSIGMHRKVFRAYARELLREDLVVEERSGRARRYHATSGLVDLLDRWAPEEPGHPDRPRPKGHSPGLDARGDLQ